MRAMIYPDLDAAWALAQRMRREGLYWREWRADPSVLDLKFASFWGHPPSELQIQEAH
jgi:hypothetical protein